MKLLGVIYKNTEIDDQQTFRFLPAELKQFLSEVNGIVAFKGGLHIRGCCISPLWHSLNEAMTGKLAFWKHYPEILDTDIPFAQDCMGDQFLLRHKKVIKLFAETGEVEETEYDFIGFLEAVAQDPISILSMYPLIQFEMDGMHLEPGQLLQAYPPLLLRMPAEGIHLKAASIEDHLKYLAEISRKYRMKKDSEDDFNFFVS